MARRAFARRISARIPAQPAQAERASGHALPRLRSSSTFPFDSNDDGPGMKHGDLLLFGPLGAFLFAAGIVGLAFLVPGYSHVHQTVSEIGEMDSPARIPFTVMLCAVAACLVVFAFAVRDVSIRAGHATLAAWLIGCGAVSAAGVGIFSFPHPLHNVFGESELIGYQAPLALALAWRRDPRAKGLVAFSWILFALMWIAIALNLTILDRHGALFAQVRPVYGLVQRSLFATWFSWCAVVGVLLWRGDRRNQALSAQPAV
jgi:hypothetical membrane protein